MMCLADWVVGWVYVVVLWVCVEILLVGMLCWMVWTGFIGDGVWCVVGLCGLWVAGLIHSDGVMCCVCVGFGGVGP